MTRSLPTNFFHKPIETISPASIVHQALPPTRISSPYFRLYPRLPRIAFIRSRSLSLSLSFPTRSLLKWTFDAKARALCPSIENFSPTKRLLRLYTIRMLLLYFSFSIQHSPPGGALGAFFNAASYKTLF